MKKLKTSFLTLLLMLVGAVSANATKLFATYGTPASQGSWDASTGTYSWTAIYSNLMTIFEFPNGELADYTSLNLVTSDYTDAAYRVCFMNGGTAVATISFYSAGNKNLVLSERSETKDLDLSKITHISFGGASASGSIVLSKAYLEKPFQLTVDEYGKAYVTPSDLIGSGFISVDEQTGVVTSTKGEDGAPTWGRLAINLPSEGVDLSNLTGFTMNYEGTVLFSNFEIGSKGFWSSITGRSDLASYTADFGDPTAVTTWRWNADKAGTMTIKNIELRFATMTASNPHETPLTAALFNDSYCECNLGEMLGQGSTIYGNGSVVADKYADLAGYDELRIYGTPGQDVRLLFNWGTTKNEVIQTLDADGYTAIDLTALPAQQLNAFKFPWNGKTAVIKKMILYKKTVTSPYDYVISGSGVQTASVFEALADETAAAIDATGVTKAVALATANPNCLIVANEGMVTNAQNVVVDGTCANLVLTDGKPFKAPVSFTATAASFAKSVSAAGFSTMVIPFAAALPAGVEAFDVTGVSGSELVAEAVTAVAADQPVLLKNAGDYAFTAADAAVAATTTAVNGALTATYATVKAPAGAYVLQKLGTDPAAFYQVEADSEPTVQPFRAWLTAGGGAKVVTIRLDEATGIASLPVSQERRTASSALFNLAGQRVQKATKGLYIVDGKKVVVK